MRGSSVDIVYCIDGCMLFRSLRNFFFGTDFGNTITPSSIYHWKTKPTRSDYFKGSNWFWSDGVIVRSNFYNLFELLFRIRADQYHSMNKSGSVWFPSKIKASLTLARDILRLTLRTWPIANICDWLNARRGKFKLNFKTDHGDPFLLLNALIGWRFEQRHLIG